MEIITIGNKNITVYSTPTLGNAQLERGRKTQREPGRWMELSMRERERFVNEASRVEVETKTRRDRDIFFLPFILATAHTEDSHE